jgi:hypothetical protein
LGQRSAAVARNARGEIVVLRQQINVLRRANPNRLPFGSIDKLILGGVCRLFPKLYDHVVVYGERHLRHVLLS